MTPSSPRLFVDSADRSRVSALLSAGLVHGVTTNPTILERDGHRWDDITALGRGWIAEGARQVFFQTWGPSVRALHEHAAEIRAIDAAVGVKVPATRAGFQVAAELVRDGAEVLLTAVSSPAQALAAASLGVHYIAAYLGRMRDAGRDGDGVIASMQAMCEGSVTEVLAASLRSPHDITGLHERGVRFFTAAPEVLEAVFHDDVTEASTAVFEEAMVRIG